MNHFCIPNFLELTRWVYKERTVGLVAINENWKKRKIDLFFFDIQGTIDKYFENIYRVTFLMMWRNICQNKTFIFWNNFKKRDERSFYFLRLKEF